MCSQKDISRISSLKSPSNVLAICKIPKNESNLKNEKPWTFLDNISDPGNLGTIRRLCDWFGIKDIICSENSVDCFNPKTIQASMGSICRVNISYVSFKNLISNQKNNLIAADMKGKNINNFPFKSNQIILFGSESNGFRDDLSNHIEDKITIPRYNQNIDSLNLASSVAIVLSELKNKITEK